MSERDDEHRAFRYVLAALAAANGGSFRVKFEDLANIRPGDSIEQSLDTRTGDIIYTLVRAS